MPKAGTERVDLARVADTSIDFVELGTFLKMPGCLRNILQSHAHRRSGIEGLAWQTRATSRFVAQEVLEIAVAGEAKMARHAQDGRGRDVASFSERADRELLYRRKVVCNGLENLNVDIAQVTIVPVDDAVERRSHRLPLFPSR